MNIHNEKTQQRIEKTQRATATHISAVAGDSSAQQSVTIIYQKWCKMEVF